MRPRLTAVDSRGRSLFVTAGYGYDKPRRRRRWRTRGAPDGDSVSRRIDKPACRHRRDSEHAAPRFRKRRDAVRARLQLARSRVRSGSGRGDRSSTGFLEVTRSFAAGKGATVFGAALQLDEFENELNGRYNHSWLTPGLF